MSQSPIFQSHVPVTHVPVTHAPYAYVPVTYVPVICPGYPHCPGHPCPSHPCPSHPFPGHPCPGHPCPSHPCPGHPCMPRTPMSQLLMSQLPMSRSPMSRSPMSWSTMSWSTMSQSPMSRTPMGRVQAHLGPWPRDFWPMAVGLSGPKWAYIFLIVSLACSCDERNFKLLLRKKIFKKKVKILVKFQGLRKVSLRQKNVFVSLACNVMKQTLSYYALYVITCKRLGCVHHRSLHQIFTGKISFWKNKFFKSNSKFVSSHFQANKTIKKVRPT